ncbi:hypothetical protein JXA32_03785 [Candidatus Sumerlaeota bacterium]|nr:hypothetical protein [Candidatus Sumerlaeota bacterium]
MEYSRRQKIWIVLLYCVVVLSLVLGACVYAVTHSVGRFAEMAHLPELPIVFGAMGVSIFLALLLYLTSFTLGFPHRPRFHLCLLFFTSGVVTVPLFLDSFNEALGAFTWPVVAAICLAPWLLIVIFMEILAGWLFYFLGMLPYRWQNYGLAGRLFGAASVMLPREQHIDYLKGISRFYAGDLDAAGPVLRRHWESGNRDPELIEALCDVALRTDYDLAVRLFKQRLEEDPENRELLDALIDLHHNQGDLKQAQELMEQHYSFDNAEDLWRYEDVIAESGNYLKSLDLIQRAVKMDNPDMTQAWQRIRALLQTYPDNYDLLRTAADIAARRGEKETQTGFLERLLIEHPNDVSSRVELLKIYSAQHRLVELLSHYNILREHIPLTREMLIEYIDVLEKNGRDDEAREQARAARSEHPGEAMFYLPEAVGLLEEGKLQEAMAIVREGMQKADGDSEPQPLESMRSRILQAMEARDIQSLRERVETERDNVDLFFAYIMRLAQTGKMSDGITALDEMLEEHPDQLVRVMDELRKITELDDPPYEALSCLADLMLRQRQCDETLNLYRRMAERSIDPRQTLRDGCRHVLKFEPDHFEARIELAQLSQENQEWREAIEHLHACERVDEERFKPYVLHLFNCYAQLEDVSRARYYGLAAMQDHPDDLSIPKQLADLLKKHEFYQEAMELLEKTRQRNLSDRDLLRMQKEAELLYRRDRQTELRDLVDQNPLRLDYVYELADSLYEDDKFSEAIKFYDRAKRDDGLSKMCQLKIGLCWARKGMFDLAEELVEEIDWKDRDERHTQEIKTLLYELAGIFEELEELDPALKFYKQVLKIDANFRDVVNRIETISNNIRRRR